MILIKEIYLGRVLRKSKKFIEWQNIYISDAYLDIGIS